MVAPVLMAAANMAHAQSMKVVVNSDGDIVGRYLSETNDQYTVEVQDDYTVPKTGHNLQQTNSQYNLIKYGC